MRHVGHPFAAFGLVAACAAGTLARQPEVFTLSLIPVGGSTVQAGSTVAIEVILTVDADSCPNDGPTGPADGIRFEGVQVDVPCVLPGGTSGSISSIPGSAGGTSDPDSDGLRGPSSDGIPFLFGPGGIGAYSPAICQSVAIYAPLDPPVNVNTGQSRYIGTFFYEVSECAAGTFQLFFECTDQGGSLSACEGDPERTNTTRFHNDCPVSTSPGALIRFREVGTTLTVPVGRCCDGSACLGELSEFCCTSVQGGTRWDAGETCQGDCPPCMSDSDCEDHNLCTADSCSDGLCTHVPVPNGLFCDDGLFCTASDACSEGRCVGAGDACPEEFCDEASDACVQCEINAPCDDGLFCTYGDRCLGGRCIGSPGFCLPGLTCSEELDRCICVNDANCDDANPCTDDSCDAGTCVHANNTMACDDGLNCTVTDSCMNGRCVGSGNPCPGQFCSENLNACVQCLRGTDCPPDGNACTDDVCNPQGSCQYDNDDSNSCNDGQFCTQADRCHAGTCAGTPRVCFGGRICCEVAIACRQCCSAADCDDHNECTTDDCHPVLGCRFTPHAGLCDDGNDCTDNDACFAGQCIGEPSLCDDGNPCTTDMCHPTKGCQHTNHTQPCDDGLFCTAHDRCADGICLGTPSTCPPKYSCDEDNDRCVCLSNAACDDDNDCTRDECVDGECIHVIDPLVVSCDDGLFCTVGDACASGACRGEPRVCPDPKAPVCSEESDACTACLRHQDCDDGNVCTTDRCSKVTGTCHHTPNSKPCNDGLFCTKPDVCSEGVCVGAHPVAVRLA